MADKRAVAHSSVWVRMPFICGPTGAERLRAWLPTSRDIRARTAGRRDRVLAFEWARKRLCLILDIHDAKRWNGYIPPASDDRGRADSSPVRLALIELLRDVENAEGTGAEGAG